MKRIKCMSLFMILICISGCGKYETLLVTPTPLIENQACTLIDKPDKSQFEKFFKQYFSFTEDEILELNKTYKQNQSQYASHLKNYQKIIKERLGSYLAKEALVKLEQQYLKEKLQLPRKVLIDEYVTCDNSQVIDLETKPIDYKEESIVYEVSITLLQDVEPIALFLENYTWKDEVEYYVKIQDKANNRRLDLEKEYPSKNDYTYARNMEKGERDQIKIRQKYWVEVLQIKALQIKSIEEANVLLCEGKSRVNIINMQHAKRLPYYDQVSSKEEGRLKRVFTKLMKVDKTFFNKLCDAQKVDEHICYDVLSEIGLENDFIIDQQTYKKIFMSEVSPYKDNIVKLEIMPGAICVMSSRYSTKMQPRFVTSMSIKALLSNNEIVYYNYKYFVGMDDGNIEFITFMNMELLTEEEYNEKLNENKYLYPSENEDN